MSWCFSCEFSSYSNVLGWSHQIFISSQEWEHCWSKKLMYHEGKDRRSWQHLIFVKKIPSIHFLLCTHDPSLTDIYTKGLRCMGWFIWEVVPNDNSPECKPVSPVCETPYTSSPFCYTCEQERVLVLFTSASAEQCKASLEETSFRSEEFVLAKNLAKFHGPEHMAIVLPKAKWCICVSQ